MRLALLAVAVAIAIAACAPAIPPLPSKGGPAWVELQSEHFTLWTDAGQQRGAELMKEIEDLRQVVIGTAFRGAVGRGRGWIIAFDNDDEVHGYVPPSFAAITMGGAGPFGESMIVMSANSNSQDTKRVDTHELVHLISYAVIHHQPHWFAEGLAQYFETIEIDARAGTVDVGRAATARDGSVQVRPHLTSVASLFPCQQMASGCMTPNFYATAWALFTYLTNQRPADLAKLEALLDRSTSDGRDVFAQIFGPDGEQTIDGEMRRWLANGSHTVLHFSVQLASHEVRVRTLPDAEVLASRALLSHHFGHAAAEVAQQIDAAIALDPTDVTVRVIDMTLGRPIDAAAATATAAAHPDDWRAWMLVMRSARSPEERGVANAKMCAVAANDPSAAVTAGLCASVTLQPTAPPPPSAPPPE